MSKMKTTFGHVPFEHIKNKVSPFESMQEDLVALENITTNLQEISRDVEKLAKEHDLEGYIGIEGLIWDATKTVAKSPFKIASASNKTRKFVNKSWKQFKEIYNKTIKPKFLASLKDYSNRLSIMFAKYNKLEDHYNALGKKVDYVINSKLSQLHEFPGDIKFNYHHPNYDLLAKYFTIVKNFNKAFLATEAYILQNAPDKLKFTVDDLSKVKDAIKKEDKEWLGDLLSAVNGGIAKINALGDFGILQAITGVDYTKDNKFVEAFQEETGGVFSNTLKALMHSVGENGTVKEGKRLIDKKNGDISPNLIVKLSIVGPELVIDLNKDQTSSFKQAMQSYLSNVSKILNRDLVGIALRASGNDMKKATTEITRSFEEMAKVVPDKKKEDLNGKSDSIPMNNIEITNSEKEDNNDEDMNFDNPAEQPIDVITNAFIMNMTSTVSRVASVYTQIIGGVLSGMYVIVTDANTIVELIEMSTNKGDK